MKKDNKKVTMSKAALVVTGFIFIEVIGFVMYMYISGKINDGYDTAAIVSLITVSGSLFASNLCWYSKKAASENSYKLRMASYEDSSRIRLQYNEGMMILMKKYGLTQSDIDNINETGDIDEMMDSAINGVSDFLDANRDSNDSENTVENL